MKVSHQMIRDDILDVLEKLKTQEMRIPDSWECMKPGLIVMGALVFWHVFLAWPAHLGAGPVWMMLTGSLVAGFLAFSCISETMARYLSIPEEIRKGSLVIRLCRERLKKFISIWLWINVFIGLALKLFSSTPDSITLAGFIELFTLVIISFFFSIDIRRYDFGVCMTFFNAWRDGKLSEIEELQKIITTEKIKKPEA